jgi:hypothetical protein
VILPQLHEQQDMIQQFVNQQLQNIGDHRKFIESFVSEQSEWLTEQRQTAETFLREQSAANQVMNYGICACVYLWLL